MKQKALVVFWTALAAAAAAADRPAIPPELTLRDAMRIAFEQSTVLRTAAARVSQT